MVSFWPDNQRRFAWGNWVDFCSAILTLPSSVQFWKWPPDSHEFHFASHWWRNWRDFCRVANKCQVDLAPNWHTRNWTEELHRQNRQNLVYHDHLNCNGGRKDSSHHLWNYWIRERLRGHARSRSKCRNPYFGRQKFWNSPTSWSLTWAPAQSWKTLQGAPHILSLSTHESSFQFPHCREHLWNLFLRLLPQWLFTSFN